MLRHLEIDGMAIIDRLAIDFSSGLNVITGETGAGKTILVKALRFLSGEKASQELIRKGKDSGVVVAKFYIAKNSVLYELLAKLDIPIEKESDPNLIIRRRISNTTGSSAWINDVPVTLQTLKQISMELVDIFSQHENQKLLLEENHIKYLDQFLINKDVSIRFREAFLEYKKELSNLRELIISYNELKKSKAYSELLLQEFKDFSPTIEDYNNLLERTENAKKQYKMQSIVVDLLKLFEPNDVLLLDTIKKIQFKLGELNKLANDSINLKKLFELEERIKLFVNELDELHYEISKISSQIEISEEELNFLQKRLYQYQILMRKYEATDIESLIKKFHSMMEEFTSLLDLEEEIKRTSNSLKEKARKLVHLSSLLSEERSKASIKMSHLVKKELSDLYLKSANFKVEFIRVEHKKNEALPELAEIEDSMKYISENGAEKARFLFSANEGEELLPLTKIASGGEMSRILLAIKKALTADAETCVLIFDEIDSGVSGKVADSVGHKLFELSKKFQVICITHLPQVAAYAKSHFKVEKEKNNGRTLTKVKKLTKKECLIEIARLISADKILDTSIHHAKTLLNKAQHGCLKRV